MGLHDHGFNGILADDMGLGKTIQVIAMLCYFVEVGCPFTRHSLEGIPHT